MVTIRASHHYHLGSILARTWAVIGWSQSDSEGFTPVLLPPQKTTFPPNTVSSSVLITNLWLGSLGNQSQRKDVHLNLYLHHELEASCRGVLSRLSPPQRLIFFWLLIDCAESGESEILKLAGDDGKGETFTSHHSARTLSLSSFSLLGASAEESSHAADIRRNRLQTLSQAKNS